MALKSVEGNSFFGVIVLVLALITMVTLHSMYPSVKKESFVSGGYPTSQLCKMPLTTPSPQSSGPADATIDSPRTPYHLLGDYMPPAKERLANLTSECAYIADGQRRIEQTGSYGQITNNYKKKNPDNGSTLLHELSVSFYK
jgi:hypothetical protein